jgi:hypothetical protein
MSKPDAVKLLLELKAIQFEGTDPVVMVVMSKATWEAMWTQTALEREPEDYETTFEGCTFRGVPVSFNEHADEPVIVRRSMALKHIPDFDFGPRPYDKRIGTTGSLKIAGMPVPGNLRSSGHEAP